MNPPSSVLPYAKSVEFRQRFERGVIVADGAMGTMLYGKGVFINRCYDELNLSSPSLVKEIHQEYVRAGAEVLERRRLLESHTEIHGMATKSGV